MIILVFKSTLVFFIYKKKYITKKYVKVLNVFQE